MSYVNFYREVVVMRGKEVKSIQSVAKFLLRTDLCLSCHLYSISTFIHKESVLKYKTGGRLNLRLFFFGRIGRYFTFLYLLNLLSQLFVLLYTNLHSNMLNCRNPINSIISFRRIDVAE